MRIVCIGKPGTDYADKIKLYTQRVSHYRPIDIIYARNTEKARNALRDSYIVLVDASGKQRDSQAFALWLGEHLRDIAFVIGEAEGLPKEIRDLANESVSLSKMTFPHQMARLMLIEQIYRAMTILNNHPYNK